MLKSPDAQWNEGVEPSSDTLVSSRSRVHVRHRDLSVSRGSISVEARASPKVKEEQSKPSTVSSLRSAMLGPYKTARTE